MIKLRLGIRLLLVSMLAMLPVAFQNCRELTQTDSNSNPQATEFKSLNNGGSYGGKLNGNFYRYVGNEKCNEQPPIKSMLEILTSAEDDPVALAVKYLENDSAKCSQTEPTKKDLALQDLDISVFQKEIIGYKEGLYEIANATPNKLPANLVEIWCRDRKDLDGIETLTHYDRELKKAVNRIYYSKKDSMGKSLLQIVPDFAVARVLTNQIVLVRDDHGFELKVFRDQPASQFGLFKSYLKANIEGRLISIETFCRLGGTIDPSVWPSNQISSPGTYPRNLGLSPDRKHMAFISYSPFNGRNLFVAKTDGTEPYQVNPVGSIPNILGGGLAQAIFSPDSRSLVFHTSSASQNYAHSLLEWRLDLPTHEPAIVLPIESRSIFSFAFSGDQKTLLYEHGIASSSNFTSRIKSRNLITGSTLDLTPLSQNPAIKGVVRGFAVSKTLNKLAYLWSSFDLAGADKLELYSINSDGSGLKNITPQLPSLEWRLLDWDPSEGVPSGGDYAFVRAARETEVREFAVALDGSSSVQIPMDWNWTFTSPSGKYAVLQPSNTTSSTWQAQLLNLSTGVLLPLPPLQTFNIKGYDGQGLGNASINLPISEQANSEINKRANNHPSLFFTEDSLKLIGRTPVDSEYYRAVSISTATGEIVELCPGLQAQDILIRSLGLRKVLIATLNRQNQLIEIYIAKPSSQGSTTQEDSYVCNKANSLLSTNANLESVREISISPDEKKVLVRIVKPIGFKDITTQIFYVPLDGHLPYRVNTPLHESAEAAMAAFSADSKKVVYLANQSAGQELSIFVWSIPTEK